MGVWADYPLEIYYVYLFPGVAALSQYIYVVGGYDGSQQLASVERYDTERDEWTSCAPVRVARSALSLTVLNHKLYAMGEKGYFCLTILLQASVSARIGVLLFGCYGLVLFGTTLCVRFEDKLCAIAGRPLRAVAHRAQPQAVCYG